MSNKKADDQSVYRSASLWWLRAAPSKVIDVLERYEVTVVGDPPIVALLCRRGHVGVDATGDGRPALIVPAAPAGPSTSGRLVSLTTPGASEPLAGLLSAATQEGLSLARFVEDALAHETDEHA